jgi:hypothetical protein
MHYTQAISVPVAMIRNGFLSGSESLRSRSWPGTGKAGDCSFHLMPRKANTKRLLEDGLGEYIGLAAAAHLTRAHLLPDPLKADKTGRFEDTLNLIGLALAKVAPLYVRDANAKAPRELSPLELEGASVRGGAKAVVLKDGRTLTSVTIKRADLRHGVAILQATGIPGLVPPSHSQQLAPLPNSAPSAEMTWLYEELERLLRPPLIPVQVERANSIATRLARKAPHGHVANLAMQLISAIRAEQGVDVALAKLRTALEQYRSRS